MEWMALRYRWTPRASSCLFSWPGIWDFGVGSQRGWGAQATAYLSIHPDFRKIYLAQGLFTFPVLFGERVLGSGQRGKADVNGILRVLLKIRELGPGQDRS